MHVLTQLVASNFKRNEMVKATVETKYIIQKFQLQIR